MKPTVKVLQKCYVRFDTVRARDKLNSSVVVLIDAYKGMFFFLHNDNDILELFCDIFIDC